MHTLASLPTPALVLDRGLLAANLHRMHAAVARHRVAFRPHLKTAKSAHIASLATAPEAGGIAVSTIAEAAHFAGHGFRDILLAVGITADKLARLHPIVAAGARVTVLTDHLPTAAAIADSGLGLRALVEVDCGEHRGGVAPDDPALLRIAAALGPAFTGVLTHAGHSYRAQGEEAFAAVAEAERCAAVAAAARLRDAGHAVSVVSVGSTPTALYAARLDGVTEVRAGVYMFGDRSQAAIGSCREDAIALTVLATVIGHRPEEGVLLLDAGALALSKDPGLPALHRGTPDYGAVWDLDGMPSFGAARVTRTYQEHGLATCEGGWQWDAVPVGTRVRIAPNHACLTAAAYDRYAVVHGGHAVVAEWERCRGW